MNIMTCKGYHGCFDYDENADVFHGRVINLTDVITFQGRSIDELKQALADSVDDYLDFCASEGKVPEKPYSGRFNVHLAPETHQRLALEAARNGVSLNHWVANVLSKSVDHHC